MKSKKIKLLTLGVLATLIISSTQVFAATGTSSANKIQSNKNVTDTKSSTVSSIPGTVKPAFVDWQTELFVIVTNGGVVQQGDIGLSVEQVQFLLRYRGYGISRDGVFGGQTGSAVYNWQQNHALVKDSIVGKNTAFSLLGDNHWFIWDTSAHLARIVDTYNKTLYSENI
jgi:peptidoglycan hydrolase-like protein with peptidoglycan-binding domain